MRRVPAKVYPICEGRFAKKCPLLYEHVYKKVDKETQLELRRVYALPNYLMEKCDSDDLIDAFAWEESPQGVDYWHRVNKGLPNA